VRPAHGVGRTGAQATSERTGWGGETRIRVEGEVGTCKRKVLPKPPLVGEDEWGEPVKSKGTASGYIPGERAKALTMRVIQRDKPSMQ